MHLHTGVGSNQLIVSLITVAKIPLWITYDIFKKRTDQHLDTVQRATCAILRNLL